MVEMTKEEDHEATVFIFAGYPEQMERFLKSNPGMDRRVTQRYPSLPLHRAPRKP